MDFSDRSQSSFSELTAPLRVAIRRYWQISISPALASFAIVLAISVMLPSYYAAEVLFFIQGQHLPDEVIKADDQKKLEERLDTLIQEILSRTQIKEVIERFSLYPTLSGVIGKEKAIQQFRKDTRVIQVQSPTGKPVSNVFKLEYIHHDPQTAFEVTKALAQAFIDRSLLEQREHAESTKRFLEAEISKSRVELEEIESKLQKFVRENIGKLPEQLQQALARLENAQNQLATNATLITVNRQQKKALEEEARIPSGVVDSSSAGDSDPYSQLAQLKNALSLLEAKYSAEHPDVITTKSRIKALEDSIRSGTAKTGSRSGSLVGSPTARALRLRIKDLDVEYARLTQENDNLKKNISKLEADVEQMPVREQELVKIRRDYSNIQGNYQKLLAQRDQADIASEAVRGLKNPQFRVLEPAAVPAIPVGPMRFLIALSGVGIALVTFISLPLGLFFINSAYKFRDELEKEFGIVVLTIIPSMDTPEVKTKRRRGYVTSAVVSSIFFIVISFAVAIFT